MRASDAARGRAGWARRIAAIVLAACGPGLVPAQSEATLLNPPPEAWPQHGRVPEATRYSPLSQIHRGNVDHLRLAWSRELGFAGTFQGAPAVWEGRMFLAAPGGALALDAATGDVLWRYLDPDEAAAEANRPLVPRGTPLMMHGAVIIALRSPVVVALDAVDGSVRWRTRLAEPGAAEGLLDQPIFAGGPVVVGTAAESRGPLPGRLVALDPADGTIVWTWSTLPDSPDDPGYDTWSPTPPQWRHGIGGAGILNVGAYDPRSDTVVYGTSTATPWDRLDHRRRNDGPASADLFVSSFVAIDGSDGSPKWHHQVVPGDEWEYDQRTVPMFIDVDIDIDGDAVPRRVALLATTTGFLLTVDARRGILLQAHRLAPESNVHLGYDAQGAAVVDDAMRYLGEQTATRVCPGLRWANLAPAAYSPRSELLYRPNDTVCVQQGIRPPIADPGEGAFDAARLVAEPRRADDYYDRFGALSAIDPRTGELVWEFPTPYPHDAGALATAGDLVFSPFADRVLRAFDAENGDVLWERVLSAHSDASPITYAVDGVQYLAVPVGHETGVTGLPSHGVPRSVAGRPAVFVFALDSER